MHRLITQIRSWLTHSPIYLRLFRGAFWSIIGAAVARLFSMITTIFIARFLGRDLFGSYGMIESTIGMFGMFAGLAMGSTMTKFIAEFKGKDPAKAGRILSLAKTLSLLTAAIVAGVLCFLSPWVAQKTLNRPEIAPLLRIGALLLFVSTLNGVQTQSLAGFEAFKDIARINMIQGIATPILCIPLVYFYNIAGAIIASVLIYAVGYFLASVAVRQKCRAYGIRQSYFDPSALAECKVMWTFSIPATLSGLLVIPVTWLTNTILVNQNNGYAELGLFNAANQWRHFVIIIPTILGSVMLPILSEAYGRENPQEFRRVFLINLKITWAVALPGTVAAIGFSKPLADLFGPQYQDAVPIIAVLVTTAFLNIVNNVVGIALAGSGRMWTGSLFNLAWAVTLIVATLVLAPMYGGKGLALSYLIAYAFHSMWQMAYVERKLAPFCIIGQRKLIVFSLITLIPICFLGKTGGLSYVLNGGVVLISLVPLISMAWEFLTIRSSTPAHNL